MKTITIGTRASKLAMMQTHAVIERLRQHWPGLEMTIEQISTRGDRNSEMPLTQMGSDGVFVTEIEQALLDGRIDLAVHSLKDLPTVPPDGLSIVVTGPREDVRDVIVWNDASKGDPLRIGTCSLRRTAQIRALWPGTQILPLRGNVDTRLRKLDAGNYDGIVLASAGLHRLRMQERLTGRLSYLPVEVMMPAPGQGALALEVRDEPEMHALVAPLKDPVVQAITSAERTFMRRLGAGCYLPVAAYGEIVGEMLTLHGLVIRLDGQRQVRVRQSVHWTQDAGIELAGQLGVRLAEQALAQGADEIICALDAGGEENQASYIVRAQVTGLAPTKHWLGRQSSPASPLQDKRILVTRTREQAGVLCERLRLLGAIPIELPTIRLAPPADWSPLNDALERLCRAEEERYYSWLVFTSANGVSFFFERLHILGYAVPAKGKVRVAAIGPATAEALIHQGVEVDLVPGEYIAEGVAAALIEDTRRRGETLERKRILLARAAGARRVLASELQQAGAVVDEVPVYQAIPATSDDERSHEVLRLLQNRQLDVLTFTSSSTVRNFVQWLIDCERDAAGPLMSLITHDLHPKIACIGPITSQTARKLGLKVDIEASEFTIDGLVEAIVQHEEKT